MGLVEYESIKLYNVIEHTFASGFVIIDFDVIIITLQGITLILHEYSKQKFFFMFVEEEIIVDTLFSGRTLTS